MKIDSKKLYFIHITKTAGTSIDQALQHAGADGLKHETVSEVVARIGIDAFKSYYSFCVVRNPWDRLVSLYHDRRQNKLRIPKFVTFEQWLLEMPPAEKMDRSETEMAWYSDPRCIQSNLFWISHDDKVQVDHIIRFESLHESWDEFRGQFGLPVLPHLYKSKRGDYREYYSPELCDLVEARYKEDIQHFGYKF